MEPSVALTDLPNELLVKILRYDQITRVDLISVFQTCRRLQEIAAVDSLWEFKMRNKWANWKKYRYSNLNWFKRCQNMIDIFKLCSDNIVKMSSKSERSTLFPSDYYVSIFLDLCKMFNGLGQMYVMMFLRDFCSREINTGRLYNLINQNYAWIYLDYLNQHFLKEKWLEMSKNASTFTPEKAALFFSQWMQPENDEFDSYLNAAISDYVKIITSSLSSEHPFHKIKTEELEKWSNELTYENKYNVKYCLEIIKKTVDFLNDQKILSPAEVTKSSMFIQDVIEHKNNNGYYSLIIIAAILRKCGVHVEIVYSHKYLSFSWQEDWSKISSIYNINLLTGEISFISSSYAMQSRPGMNCAIANGFVSNMASYVKHFEIESNKQRRAMDLITFLKPLNKDFFWLPNQ